MSTTMTTTGAFFRQFTPDQLRAGYARNAAELQRMADTATRTGKRLNGYTAAELQTKATAYAALSTASDAAIRAHLARPIGRTR